MDKFELERFTNAHEQSYSAVLEELTRGYKTSHWMWYIFPQLRGLGSSAHANRYGLSGLLEAQAYLAHPTLGLHLKQCVETLLTYHSEKTPEEIFGEVDAMKLRSCLTLFHMAAPHETVFIKALNRFYDGQKDPRTIELLHRR